MLAPAIRNILRVSRCKTTYHQREIHISDLKEAHHLYIVHACRKPGDTQEQFAKDLCLDKTTVTHQLNELERHGYILRKPSEQDRRCKCIFPTDKAKKAYQEIHEKHLQFTTGVMEGLTKDEQEELARLMDKVYQNALQLIQEGK